MSQFVGDLEYGDNLPKVVDTAGGGVTWSASAHALSAFASCARQLNLPIEMVLRAAGTNRLGALIEARKGSTRSVEKYRPLREVPYRKGPRMAESEHVRIPVVFSDDNLNLISPNPTFRDGDTVYTDVTVTRTENRRVRRQRYPPHGEEPRVRTGAEVASLPPPSNPLARRRRGLPNVFVIPAVNTST
jgi:hypothetical protein